MIHKMYTVFDTKAEIYLPPIYYKATGEALRAFSDTVNSSDHAFHKHPEDYCLFEIGTYDDQNAGIETITPKSLGLAIEYITE